MPVSFSYFAQAYALTQMVANWLSDRYVYDLQILFNLLEALPLNTIRWKIIVV